MDADNGSRADVVVGVDGSDLALHAVGWAATEARLRSLALRILHAAHHPAHPTGAGPRPAAEILAHACTMAHRAEPDVVVSTTRTAQDPVASLLDAAACAALLVVGMGGGDGAGEPLTGSVALDVSGRAPCPVVVVRGGPVPPRGPVLVGIDTISGETVARDDTPLTVAFLDARRHGGRVAVLHVRHGTDPLRAPRDEQAADVAARDRIRRELGPWATRFPGVPVEVSVVHGNPARALLRAAAGSRLVVLGTRGHGAYARAVFGSTSREVLRRSPVTVMIVNPGTPVTGPDSGKQTPGLTDVAILRRAIEYAVRAPSVHNSQPWRWRAGAEGVDLFADPDRYLPATDPDGRDLLLSCGAALHHLVVGLAGLGISARIDRFPDPEDSDHLARVAPLDTSPTPDAVRLAPAIARRHTDRRRFGVRPVDRALLDALVRAADDCGTHLHVVAPGDPRRRLIELITRSATLQRQQAGYAGELARWTGRYAAADDGIRADTVVSGVALPGEVPMRPFPRAGLVQSPHSFEHVDASVLLVLSSRSDDRSGALRAGEATSAILLTATDLGLATTPLSQPLEVTRTRAAISRHIVGPRVFPQIVLRVGWAQPGTPELAPTPRRRLGLVLRTD